MIYYFMLVAAAVLFSFQFLFNQRFEKECGTSFASAIIFSLYTAIGGFVLLFAISGMKMEFSWFSLMMAILSALVSLLYTIASLKALGAVNLSAYSVFAMLGGMLLPSLQGIIFFNEGITVKKLLCYFLMLAALLLLIDFKERSTKKIYYFIVFVFNGLSGVISVIHQANETAVDSLSFSMLIRLVTVIIVLPLYFIFVKTKRTSWRSLTCSFAYAAFCSIGNLLVLISLKYLPAYVQYPIITGGVMIMSFIISALGKDNVKIKHVISTVIAFASTILIIL